MNDEKASLTLKNVKNVNIENTTMVTDKPAIEADGVENFNSKNFLHIRTPKLSALVSAIKKPTANDNAGWKIMVVGVILAGVMSVVCMGLYDFYVKPRLSEKLGTQSQNVEEKKAM